MTKKTKRYIKVKSSKGIYQDTKAQNFLARKVIDGKEYSKSFSKLADAKRWRHHYHPSLPDDFEIKKKVKLGVKSGQFFEVEVDDELKIEEFLNGRNLGMNFGDLVKSYKEKRLPSLSFSSQETLHLKLKFFKDIYETPLIQINHFYLDKYVAKKVKEQKANPTRHRYSFTEELRILKTILNWYRNNYDPSFFNPVLPRHKDMGVIKKREKPQKKMKPNEIMMFFDALEGIWRDFAMTQFYLAGRVQEVAGLQTTSVNLDERSILIKDVVVWNRNKKFVELKNVTKNGDIRYVYMNNILENCLLRRLKNLYPDCLYLFHIDGKPLEYRSIQYQYNKALKKCGFYPRLSSTHIMRHSMGTITRMVTGNLDAAQAVTGHKDIRMVQHYASLPSQANKDAVNQVENFFKKLEQVS